MVKAVPGQVCGVLPTTRYQASDECTNSAIKERLDTAIRTGVPPDPRTAALAALAHAVGLGKHLYPGNEGRSCRSRLRDLIRYDPRRHGRACGHGRAERSADGPGPGEQHPAGPGTPGRLQTVGVPRHGARRRALDRRAPRPRGPERRRTTLRRRSPACPTRAVSPKSAASTRSALSGKNDPRSQRRTRVQNRSVFERIRQHPRRLDHMRACRGGILLAQGRA